MRVAIDEGPLTGGHAVRGIGVHTKLLLEYLEKQKGIDIDPVNIEKVDTSEYDVIHLPSFHPFFLSLPSKKLGRTVLTIHDLIPLVYPRHYPPGIKGRFRFYLQEQRLKNIDRVITISETSKKDIVRFLGFSADKVDVIYLAPRAVFKKLKGKGPQKKIKEKYGLPDEFVLYVGDVNYNKNLLRLGDACKKAGVPLVIVGKQAAESDFDRTHPENRPLVRFLDKYGDDKAVLRLGFVKDEDLVRIYNLASLYCQPSLYEGFGLPVLEAMACQTPVVASKTPALAEISGKAAYFVDQEDADDIADGIKKVMEDGSLRKRLIAKGEKKVKEYSWEKTAKETVEVYKKVKKGG